MTENFNDVIWTKNVGPLIYLQLFETNPVSALQW